MSQSKVCSIRDCTKPVRARGVCINHYTKLRYSGELDVILPRKAWNAPCTICNIARREPNRSYCRKCLTEYEKARYAAGKVKSKQLTYTQIKTNQLRAKYKLSWDEYTELAKNGCAICGSMDSLHVDHDHRCCPGSKTCGKCVRGVLCNNHNNGLGRFKDNVAHLQNAINYLESYVSENGV